MRITSDSNGIYIELLREVPRAAALRFELRMLPYSRTAEYTYVTFTAGTEAPGPGQQALPPGAGGGGGGAGGVGTVTVTEPDVPLSGVQRHAPYITGVGNGLIEANTGMTREQAATILHRLAGEPDASYGGQYPDVAAGRTHR